VIKEGDTIVGALVLIGDEVFYLEELPRAGLFQYRV
jgi:hypothetical protein